MEKFSPQCASGQCRRTPVAPAARTQSWLEEDDDEELQREDRDDRSLGYSVAKGQLREKLAPSVAGGGHRDRAWGGAQRLVTVGGLGPSRDDEINFVSVPGRYVPIGFARYVAPTIDPSDYEYYRLAGWRVAVPRSIPGFRVQDLLQRIMYFGPQSAGYIRMADVLVPAILEPGDRMTLAQSSLEFSAFPLSP